jgi:hypothetical protein
LARIEAAAGAAPGGFMVRLHVLGDFYSTDYVQLLAVALTAFPALHVFGFTARDPAILRSARCCMRMAKRDWERFAVRFQGLDGP